MHGQGIFEWSNGIRFEGEYLNDLKHGIGKFEWPDGRWYKGQWSFGKQDGYGIYYVPNEQSESSAQYGQWNDGK